MKLRVLQEYRRRSAVYPAGSEIEVEPDEARRLLEAKPGVFEVVDGEKPERGKRGRGESAAPADEPQD